MNSESNFDHKSFKFYKLIAKGNERQSPSGVPRYVNVPKARSGHRSVTDAEGNIYSFGGYNPNVDENDEDLEFDEVWVETNPLFQELWKFNVSTLTWTKLKTTGEAPIQLASHCAVLIDDNIYVFGGTGIPFGANSSNKIYVCNLRTLIWQRLQINEQLSVKPEEQYGQSVVYSRDEDALYTVGGTNGLVYSIDIHKFDLQKKVWSEVFVRRGNISYPQERYRHEAVLYKNRIYIFGGGTATTSFGFKEVPTFDLLTCKWEILLTHKDPNAPQDGYPMKRRCHGCVHIDDEVFVVGGLNNQHIYDDLWRFNLETSQWTLMQSRLPLPVYFHSTSVSPFGQMAVFGGVTSSRHNLRTGNLYSIWLKVPPLQELAWNALLSSFRNVFLFKMSSSDLRRLGIPKHFVRRLTSSDYETRHEQQFSFADAY